MDKFLDTPTYNAAPQLTSCALFFQNLSILIRVFHWRVWLDQVPRTVVGRILAPSFGNWMTFDVGSLALRALYELHLFLAAACIFDILRSAHFQPSRISQVKWGLDMGDSCLLTMLYSQMTCVHLLMMNTSD